MMLPSSLCCKTCGLLENTAPSTVLKTPCSLAGTLLLSQRMTNYHLTPPTILPSLAVQEAKEKRRRVLEKAANVRRANYHRYLEKNADCNQTLIWYNTSTMAAHPTPIDISTMPDLVQIVEEVAATKTPRELKRDNKIVAVLMPSDTQRKTSIQDALALAGAWKDIPSDDMEELLHRIRHESKPTPPFTLDDA